MLISIVCIVTFYFHGFYTYGRAYRGRYKALLIIEAVSLSYLFIGAFSFLAGKAFSIPRSVLLLAWGLTVVMLVTSCLWTMLWRLIVTAETRRIARKTRTETVERVLVIGGAGYIGSALIPKLLDKGYYVRVLDLLLYGIEPIEPYLNHPRLEVVKADFRQVDKVVEAVKGMDAVIHLGALVGDPACALDEELTIEVNLMATRMIAQVAKGSDIQRFRVRF